jgi:predicted nucleic acid-binding protein
MKILVDTSVWSLALRRNKQSDYAEKLTDLIHLSQVVMIGPVRQELLSGISNSKAFEDLKIRLEYFDDLPITTSDYETAAEYFNLCRSHGIQGAHTDFLICAVAANNNLLIFTTDKDFEYYAKHLPIRIYEG